MRVSSPSKITIQVLLGSILIGKEKIFPHKKKKSKKQYTK